LFKKTSFFCDGGGNWERYRSDIAQVFERRKIAIDGDSHRLQDCDSMARADLMADDLVERVIDPSHFNAKDGKDFLSQFNAVFEHRNGIGLHEHRRRCRNAGIRPPATEFVPAWIR